MPDEHPAPAKAPVQPNPRHQRYVAHTTFHLPNGDRFVRGDVLADKDAVAFEAALKTGETDINFATPTLY